MTFTVARDGFRNPPQSGVFHEVLDASGRHVACLIDSETAIRGRFHLEFYGLPELRAALVAAGKRDWWPRLADAVADIEALGMEAA